MVYNWFRFTQFTWIMPMSSSPLLHKVEKVCKEHNLLDPTELLTGLTNGIDLRRNSLVYEWIIDFENKYGKEELPDEDDWYVLKEMLKDQFRYAPVTLAESLTAQKTLLEYLHPKKKSVDVNQNTGEQAVTPLKPSEVKRFLRKFEAKC